VGLTAEYGYLSYRRDNDEAVERFRGDLAAVHAILAAEGLRRTLRRLRSDPTPTAVPSTRSPGHGCTAFGGCILLVLQHEQDTDWLPDPAGEDFPDRETDPAIAEELWWSRSHLIVHSDEKGWYVPIDFRYPLYGNDTDKVPGGILGSSVRLLDELRSIAPSLRITLDRGGGLDDAAASSLNAVDDNDPWWREKCAWFHLFEPARLSIELGTAVVFT
jgi:hypothetical protein